MTKNLCVACGYGANALVHTRLVRGPMDHDFEDDRATNSKHLRDALAQFTLLGELEKKHDAAAELLSEMVYHLDAPDFEEYMKRTS